MIFILLYKAVLSTQSPQKLLVLLLMLKLMITWQQLANINLPTKLASVLNKRHLHLRYVMRLTMSNKWNFCQDCIFPCFGNLAPVSRNIQIHHILGKSCVRLFQLNETCVKIAKLSSKIYLLLLCWPLTPIFKAIYISKLYF